MLIVNGYKTAGRDLLLNIIIIYIVGYLAIDHLFCQIMI